MNKRIWRLAVTTGYTSAGSAESAAGAALVVSS